MVNQSCIQTSIYNPRGCELVLLYPPSQLSCWKQMTEKDKAYLNLLIGDYRAYEGPTMEENLRMDLLRYWHKYYKNPEGNRVRIDISYVHDGETSNANTVIEADEFFDKRLDAAEFNELMKPHARKVCRHIDVAVPFCRISDYTITISQFFEV